MDYDAGYRLTGVDATPFSYDAAGNTVSDGERQFVYNARNRMAEANGHRYGYNALNLRVFKPRMGVAGDITGDGQVTEQDLGLLQQALRGDVPTTMAMDCNQDGVVDHRDTACIARKIGAHRNQGQTRGRGHQGPPTADSHAQNPVQLGWVLFVYDDNGQLIGEYDEQGNPLRLYVWLEHMPIAMLTDNGIHYLHTDHLHTPRVATDQTGQVSWQADYTPFGEVTETVSQVEMNLRFPGQYHDRETGLHQNWHREYAPHLGRYTQADPIGLRGGLNAYAYASGNPVRMVDSFGLRPYLFSITVGGGVSFRLVPVPAQVLNLEVADPIRGEICNYTVSCIGIGWSFRSSPMIALVSKHIVWDDGTDCGSCRQFEGYGMAGSAAVQAGPVGYTLSDWLDVPDGPRLDLSGFSPTQFNLGGGTFICRFSL